MKHQANPTSISGFIIEMNPKGKAKMNYPLWPEHIALAAISAGDQSFCYI